MIEKEELSNIISEICPVMQKRMSFADWHVEWCIVPEKNMHSNGIATCLYSASEFKSMKLYFNENYWLFHDDDDIDLETAIRHTIIHEFVHKWLKLKEEFEDKALWEEQFANTIANALLDVHKH